MLSAGWADASAGNYERALVPWRILIDRDTTDSAVQEARLALPFAYGKLNVYGRAALFYGQALDSFGGELEKVDASIRSIREGNFLTALVREEIHQDQNWVVRLRMLPDAPETFYLTALMASHDFQTALHNYLDLEDLHRKLVTWQGSFDAFDDLIRLRRANYEPLLPEVGAQFRELDSQMKLRVEQRDQLRKRLQDILTAPRPELLATTDERIALERIRGVEKAIAGVPEEQRAELQERVQHLKGVLIWNLRTEYPERLTQAHKNLRALQQDIDVLTAQYELRPHETGSRAQPCRRRADQQTAHTRRLALAVDMLRRDRARSSKRSRSTSSRRAPSGSRRISPRHVMPSRIATTAPRRRRLEPPGPT